MARERKLRVQITLTYPFSEQDKGTNFFSLIDRVWTNLLAMDFVIDEVFDSTGVIIGEWDSEDTSILTKVHGVASVAVLPPKEPKYAEVVPLHTGKDRMKKMPYKKGSKFAG